MSRGIPHMSQLCDRFNRLVLSRLFSCGAVTGSFPTAPSSGRRCLLRLDAASSAVIARKCPCARACVHAQPSDTKGNLFERLFKEECITAPTDGGVAAFRRGCFAEHTHPRRSPTLFGGIMASQEPSPPSSLEGNKPGFPRKILANNLESKHLCKSCQKVLRRPLQAQCGHRFCCFCFRKIVR